jgi:hypothetical protein
VPEPNWLIGLLCQFDGPLVSMVATGRILPLESCADPSLINKEVEILKAAAASSKEPSGQMAIVSHDEKPGATAPDLPPQSGVHAAFASDHEYRRHGALSLGTIDRRSSCVRCRALDGT